MSTIDPTNAPAPTPSTVDRKAGGDVFGKDAFMKLLVEQLQNQSTVQQQHNAASLIGHTVKYLDDQGTTVEGIVEAVDYGSNGAPKLTVAGKAGIEPGKVFQVR